MEKYKRKNPNLNFVGTPRFIFSPSQNEILAQLFFPIKVYISFKQNFFREGYFMELSNVQWVAYGCPNICDPPEKKST